ncbi:DUF397 domain-containing protein [Streptomyces megasporus]|uniref:DUF397 domain-containing protein n=1 Tax=Streptomyces megasporus TaxID=44060 RepID=UPI0004E27C6D|nr:DUF397 domain-containing protein [Streptomyces megasporus]
MNTERATGTSGLVWFKSSYSGGDGGECVEIAATPSTVHVRDSKEPGREPLAFPRTVWSAFVGFAAE